MKKLTLKKENLEFNIFETKRLYFRELNTKDAKNMYLLNLDKEVIKYTGDKSFKSIKSAKIFLENYDHYKNYKFGRWAVILKSNHAFLGWCGLKFTPDLNEYDIGFRFFKKYWNKGYATEAAQACIDIGFNKYGIKEIVGRARYENLNSIKVLKKIGLTYSKPFNFDGEKGVIFKININSHENKTSK